MWHAIKFYAPPFITAVVLISLIIWKGPSMSFLLPIIRKEAYKVAIALLIMAGFLGYIGHLISSNYDRLLQRKLVPAKITSFEIVRKAKRTSSSGPLQNYWVIDTKYEYELDGKKYTGTEFSNSDPHSNAEAFDEPSAELKNYKKKYPVGKDVNVHVSPKDPAKAYLEITDSGTTGFYWAASVFVSLAIIVLFFRT